VSEQLLSLATVLVCCRGQATKAMLGTERGGEAEGSAALVGEPLAAAECSGLQLTRCCWWLVGNARCSVWLRWIVCNV